jgi:hypothetical protein
MFFQTPQLPHSYVHIAKLPIIIEFFNSMRFLLSFMCMWNIVVIE